MFECGSELSSFDSNGCLREFCSFDADCGPDERCSLVEQEGGVDSDSVVCAAPFTCKLNESGGCTCGGAADCRGYCIPR